jgi:hypothetical protein
MTEARRDDFIRIVGCERDWLIQSFATAMHSIS